MTPGFGSNITRTWISSQMSSKSQVYNFAFPLVFASTSKTVGEQISSFVSFALFKEGPANIFGLADNGLSLTLALRRTFH